MNSINYRYAPERRDAPTSPTAKAIQSIASQLDEIDPDQAGLLAVGIVAPLGDVSDARIEMMLKADRPQMVTFTLSEPLALVSRLHELDVLAHVEVGTQIRSDEELIDLLATTMALRVEQRVFDTRGDDGRELLLESSRSLDEWSKSMREQPCRVVREGDVGVLLLRIDMRREG